MSKNSDLIFRGQQHRLTAPFGEWRDNHTRQHMGTDYGTYGKKAVQHCPADGGLVHNVVTVEVKGNPRGKYADIRWERFGMIFQHADSICVEKGQKLAEGDPVVLTGMTGKDNSGNRVSTGVHAHIEVYEIDTGTRVDFEKFDMGSLSEMVKNIKILMDGKEKTVASINKDGYNFVKLRDLEPAVSVDYDFEKNLPIVNSKGGMP